MKQVYKCEIDGKIFDNRGDCLKHEFALKDGNKLFVEEVNATLTHLTEKYGLEFVINEIKAEVDWDHDPNTDVANFAEWHHIDVDVYANGVQRGDSFSRGSQGNYTKEVIIEEIVSEYVAPYNTKFEGYLTNNEEYYSCGFDLEGVNLDKILRTIYDSGKKIRIEVIQ